MRATGLVHGLDSPLFPTGTSLVLAALFSSGCKVDATQNRGSWLTAMTLENHDPYFPIAQGTHAGTDCNNCHGGFDTFKEFDCLNGCHPQPDTESRHPGVTGFEYTSASCYSCHPHGTVDGAVNHDEFFPIGTGSNHDGVACATCHTDPSDHRVFSCLEGSCHPQAQTDPNHGGVSGYAFSSPSCYSCHPKGTAEGVVNHDQFFPTGASSHHDGIPCAICHIDPQDRTVFSCLNATCHTRGDTDPSHAGVSGYAFATPSCYSCHPQGTAAGAANHDAFFPMGAGSHHDGVSCVTCHIDPQDYKTFSCLDGGCHPEAETDPAHSGVSGYAFVSASCYSCHPNGVAAGAVNHAAFFPITPTDAHGNVACATCHADSTDHTNVTCASATCHASATAAGQHGAVGGYVWSSPLCLRCHADSPTERVSAHVPFGISSTFKHYRKSCLTCHDGMRIDKPWGTDFAPFKCFQGCHNQAEMADTHHEFPSYGPDPHTCVSAGCHQNGRKPN